MKTLGIVVSSFLVAGCLPMGGFRITETGEPDSFSVSIISDGRCGADRLKNLLDQNESALEGVVLPSGTRIIRPGSIFSLKTVASRLNIGIAADGTIVQVDCG